MAWRGTTPIRCFDAQDDHSAQSLLTHSDEGLAFAAPLAADKIAERLFLSGHTVRIEVKAIYRKLGVSSRNDVVQRATEIGLLGH
jgi:DNA-binding NarL/FixJ family response regulator